MYHEVKDRERRVPLEQQRWLPSSPLQHPPTQHTSPLTPRQRPPPSHYHPTPAKAVPPSRMRLPLLLAFLTLARFSSALYFYLEAGANRCFLEELPKDTIVVGTST